MKKTTPRRYTCNLILAIVSCLLGHSSCQDCNVTIESPNPIAPKNSSGFSPISLIVTYNCTKANLSIRWRPTDHQNFSSLPLKRLANSTVQYNVILNETNVNNSVIEVLRGEEMLKNATITLTTCDGLTFNDTSPSDYCIRSNCNVSTAGVNVILVPRTRRCGPSPCTEVPPTPENPKETKLRKGSAGHISATFHANPPNMSLDDISTVHSGSPITNCYLEFDGTKHTLIIHFTEVSDSDLGQYNITLRYQDGTCLNNETVLISAVEDDSAAWVTPGAISAIVVGGVLFIVLIANLSLFIRSRCGKSKTTRHISTPPSRNVPTIQGTANPGNSEAYRKRPQSTASENYEDMRGSTPTRHAERPPMPPPSRQPPIQEPYVSMQGTSPPARYVNRTERPPRSPALPPSRIHPDYGTDQRRPTGTSPSRAQPAYSADQRRPSALPPRREVAPPAGALSLSRDAQAPRRDMLPPMRNAPNPHQYDNGARGYQMNQQGIPENINDHYYQDQRGYTLPQHARY